MWRCRRGWQRGSLWRGTTTNTSIVREAHADQRLAGRNRAARRELRRALRRLHEGCAAAGAAAWSRSSWAVSYSLNCSATSSAVLQSLSRSKASAPSSSNALAKSRRRLSASSRGLALALALYSVLLVCTLVGVSARSSAPPGSAEACELTSCLVTSARELLSAA